MDSHKAYASEQLLSLSRAIIKEMEGVRRSKEDDALDSEYKTGARDAFTKATQMIYERVEKLVGEFELKK